MAHAAARLLDLTRLVSRVGRGPDTGIDRVERAYLRQFMLEPEPLFALIKTSLGFALLDRAGISYLRAKLDGKLKWECGPFVTRVLERRGKFRWITAFDVKNFCVAHSSHKSLAKMLQQHLPDGITWTNVGHANLGAATVDAIKSVPCSRIHVLVHDMIPLEFPQYQRYSEDPKFQNMMMRVSKVADLVIYNSAHSQQTSERYFTKWGRVPTGLVAHLGVEKPVPEATNLPSNLDLSRPYFVALGTIEPRKNHALLLDIWDELAKRDTPPQLFILGTRGWRNEEVFARLDANPLGVVELGGLDDGAMATLLEGAHALLSPSLAEGFGLPPCEAVLLGTRVISSDLEVMHEILGNIPIYANATDMYSWVKIIREIAGKTKAEQKLPDVTASIPTWKDHFNLVLNVSR